MLNKTNSNSNTEDCGCKWFSMKEKDIYVEMCTWLWMRLALVSPPIQLVVSLFNCVDVGVCQCERWVKCKCCCSHKYKCTIIPFYKTINRDGRGNKGR